MTYGILIAILIIALIATLFAVVIEPLPAEERDLPGDPEDAIAPHGDAGPFWATAIDPDLSVTEPVAVDPDTGENDFQNEHPASEPFVPEVLAFEQEPDLAPTDLVEPLVESGPEPPLDIRDSPEDELNR